MALVNRSGLTLPNTLASGERIELMGKEDLSMLMVIFMMATGPMTKPMGWVPINMSMAHSTRVCGKTIYNMVMALRPGLISLNMKENMLSVGSMESEVTSGMTVLCTQGTGGRIKYRELEYILGWMAGDTKENGLTTTWKAWEFTFGMMAGCTRGSIRMIKSTGLEYILGLIRDAMKAIGTRESSMGLEPM